MEKLVPNKATTGTLTKEFYKTRELTQVLGVNKDTLNRWTRAGYLKAFKLPGSAGHLYRREHIEDFLASRETTKKPPAGWAEVKADFVEQLGVEVVPGDEVKARQLAEEEAG